jgi:hypothetical protein
MEDLPVVISHAVIDNPIMNTKFKVYTYITPDHEPGTMIVHPDLTTPFDEQKLFEMDSLVISELSLIDILKKGFIKLGSTDIMSDMDIEYPLIKNEQFTKNRIVGKHWDYSQKDVAIMFGKEFEVEENQDVNSDDDSQDILSQDILSQDSDKCCIRTDPVDYIDIDNESEGEVDKEIYQLDSTLKDEKMDEIMDKIDHCQNTYVKNIDRLLSEFEF